MNARTHASILAGIAIIAAIGMFILLRHKPAPDTDSSRIVSAPGVSEATGSADAGTAPTPAGETAAAAAALIAADNTPEVQATRRMYMAHASLRTPEIADPDSEANRLILETMVKKALANQISTPTAATPESSSN